MTTPLESGRQAIRRAFTADQTAPRLMLAALAVIAAAAAAACAPAAPAASVTASASPASPVASTSPAVPSPQPSASATQAASSKPIGACVDVGDLADLGEPVVSAFTAIKPALEAQKIDDARGLAQTAIKGMTSMAELVGPASPQAKDIFTTAAAELTKAASQFPSGVSLVDQARGDLDRAFALAQAARCAA